MVKSPLESFCRDAGAECESPKLRQPELMQVGVGAWRLGFRLGFRLELGLRLRLGLGLGFRLGLRLGLRLRRAAAVKEKWVELGRVDDLRTAASMSEGIDFRRWTVNVGHQD